MDNRKIGTKILSLIIVIGISIVVLSFGFQFLKNSEIESSNIKSKSIVLQNEIKAQLEKKKAVGLTNAVSFSSNGVLSDAIVSNNREKAISEIKSISKKYKENTNFKGIKVHLHTKDLKSFVRSWKLQSFGDDLSTFRSSLVNIKSTQKADVVFELGRSGMFIRGLVPMHKDGKHVGSVEFMQGVGSVNRDFAKQKKHYLMVLNQDATAIAKGIVNNKKFGSYYLSNPKWVKKETISFASSFDMDKLIKDGYIKNDKFFVTYVPLRDVRNKIVGYHIIGEDVTAINQIISDTENLGYTYIGVIAISILIFVIGVSIAIRKIVITKLENLENGLLGFFKYLNKELSTVEPLEISSNDEIGIMSKVINDNIIKTKQLMEEDNRLINDVKSVVNNIKDGNLDQQITTSTSNKELEELKNLLNEMLNILKDSICDDLNKINTVIDEYKNLDFRHRVENSDGKIALGINQLSDIITKMLVENKTNGLTLENSSDTLLDNVNMLNKNSNEAAAELEETAAALEEVTSNISTTTSNIVKISKYAEDVTVAVSKGQDLAGQTTSSMDDINEEVTAINDAISVIDQIAFQTNILSLNAAVEAATAGEAGKGFAVVAQEVRNLASRSAEAANEIKDLVQTAIKKANTGKQIADNMIDGYTHLNENISKTIELISAVETASKVQQSGIIQINNAVNSLDRQTQENASIATHTQEISIQNDGIAKLIVSNANEKEFIGKDSINI